MPMPMPLTTEYLHRTAHMLETAPSRMAALPSPDSPQHQMYRHAAGGRPGMAFEAVEGLLRKMLKRYVGLPRAVDQLPFRDLLRRASRYGVLDEASVRCWMVYRHCAEGQVAPGVFGPTDEDGFMGCLVR